MSKCPFDTSVGFITPDWVVSGAKNTKSELFTIFFESARRRAQSRDKHITAIIVKSLRDFSVGA